MLNHLLAGRYRVVQTLGEGGLAKTYIAEDNFQPSRPKCAVKLLKPASDDSSFLPIARRLFIKEAEILERLGRHPQIPQLLAHFEEKKAFLIIQEFIEGHTLSTELPAGHCWSENKVILMLKDVLRTLDFVHSYGVIHRDIKPNNLIRRDEDGQLVLIDFGAVKQVSDPRITTKTPMTPKTISIGTQGYMPTEQARGKPRLNSDIYALGMIGIQALTGIDPINLQEDKDGEVIWQNYAQVNEQLAAVLRKMVCYHFRDRYQSAKEVLQALELFSNESLGNKTILISSQLNSTIAAESTVRKTKISLEKEHSDTKVFSHDILDNSEVSQEMEELVNQKVLLEQIRETKISLNSEPVDIKPSSKSNFKKANKAPIKKDIWSSWNTEENSVISEKTQIKVEKKAKNQEKVSLNKSKKNTEITKQTSWNLWDKETTLESLKNKNQATSTDNHLAQKKVVQAKSNKYFANEITKDANKETVAKSQIRETKVSLKNEDQDIKHIANSKETRISQKNQYSGLQKKLNINSQERQISLVNRSANILAISSKKSNRLKLYFNYQKFINKYSKENSENTPRNLNQIYSSLCQFYKTNNPDLTVRKRQKKILLLTLVFVLIIISLHTVYNSIKNTKYQLQAQKDFDKFQMLVKSQKYKECIEQGQIFANEFSDLKTKVDELLTDCYAGQLIEAQNLAQQSKLKDAIRLASQIPQDRNIYSEAQQLISQWSKQIYQIANNKYQEGKLKEAIAIIKAIPTNSNLATELQITIKQWHKDWEEDQTYLQAAQKALDERRWPDAIDAVGKLSQNAYWQEQGQIIVEKAKSGSAAAEVTTSKKHYPPPVTKPIFIPGVTNIKDLPIDPNHPINDRSRDWVKEKLGRN